MRELVILSKNPREFPYISATVNFLNRILGVEKDSLEFWGLLKRVVLKKYVTVIEKQQVQINLTSNDNDEEEEDNYKEISFVNQMESVEVKRTPLIGEENEKEFLFSDQIDNWNQFIERVLHLCNIKITSLAQKSLVSIFDVSTYRFQPFHIAKISAGIKKMSLSTIAGGIVYAYRSFLSKSHQERNTYFEISKNYLEKALSLTPSSILVKEEYSLILSTATTMKDFLTEKDLLATMKKNFELMKSGALYKNIKDFADILHTSDSFSKSYPDHIMVQFFNISLECYEYYLQNMKDIDEKERVEIQFNTFNILHETAFLHV